MGAVFAIAYSIPVSGQPMINRVSQSATTETPAASGDGQPVKAPGGQLAVFLGHEQSVTSAVFSPDGRQILTASYDETARLWDTSGKLLVVFRGHEQSVTSAVFSPDGRQILTASDAARLWDASGKLLAVLQGHEESVTSAVFNPNGRQILTVSDDETARLWDTKGNLLKEFRDKDGVTSAVFSPDGNQILTASGKAVRLWNTSGNLLTEFRGQETGVITEVLRVLNFSPDGNQILTASGDGTVNLFAASEGTAHLWDTSGKLLAVFRGHKQSVTSAVFSPDGRQILTTSFDRTARLWDTKGNLLAEFRGHEPEPEFNGIQLFSPSTKFSPDGSQIITAGSKTARLWNVSGAIASQAEQMTALQAFEEKVSENNANVQLVVFRGHKDAVNHAVFSSNGRQILTASGGTIRRWDTKGNLLTEFREENTDKIASPDGSQILTEDNPPRLWDTSGNLLAVFRENEETVWSAKFSPDGTQVLTTGVDNNATTARSDYNARLWDTSGNLLAVFRGHKSLINIAKFSPDGRQIFTASTDETARLWDTSGNLLVEFRGLEESVLTAEFSPDGHKILTTSGRTARLWDTSGNLLVVFQGHENSVKSAVFSPDGRQILTASDDKTARLWDTSGKLLAVFRGHEHWVNSAVFSPDGRQILTASNDRTARLWDVPTAIAAQAEQTSALQAFQAGVSQNNAPQAAAALQEAIQLNQQGTVESRQLAIQKLEQALALYRADKNHAKVALTLLSIGNIYANFGQFQTALDSYSQALPLSRQAGAKVEEAAILNSLGQLYSDLADPKTALDYYNQALPLFYQLNDKGAVATTLNNIGSINATLGKTQNALDSYNQALTISRNGGDQAAEAASLMGIGSIYTTSKEWSNALNAYNQSLIISRYINDKVKETTILNQLGKIHAALGQNSTAIEHYNQALSLSQQLGYKTEEAHILYNQATLNRQQNNLTAAKTQIETAINIIESLRTQIASQQLRQSYFARNQDYYQFYIDLLMQLHQQNPNKGYDGEALHISERARARSLLELLTEATANIRSGADPKLLEQERNLQQQLNDFEHRKYQLQSGQYNEQEIKEIKQKIDTVLAQLKQLEAQIRTTSPRYAALKYPEPLNLQQIQQQILDDDTLLLQYSLGEERSYLWAVTKNSITSYVLPKQSEIEAAVETFRKSVTQNSDANLDSGLALSQMLLAPVANQLSNKRLLIVGDGVLQYVPFAALPSPSSPKNPLLVQNEIVTLPSISTVAIQRRQLQNRSPVAKTVAVIADPVFTLQDDRMTGNPPAQTPDTLSNRNLNRAARNSLGLGQEGGGNIFERLRYTRNEADRILALVPEAQRFQAFDFNASRQIATNPDLAQYQIIHFATHGLLDPVNPELSGIVLSLYNQKGNPEDGFLRLHDIFNLNLPAELVVLSACQTGLGENVKGEGLVGLTRGFMYAGARRVVVSLWSVNDAATSELMAKFYQKMLQEGQNPVKALREAQLEMWNSSNRKSPYYWAAFTVQGDWR